MTPQQIVGMAVRLFAIWLVVIAFQSFAGATAMQAQLGDTGSYVLYLLPVLPLTMAVLLWLFPMTIAYKLVPRTNDTNTVHASARDLVAVASVIIGIWVLIRAVPVVVIAIGMTLSFDQSLLSVVYFTPERKLEFIGTMLQCALALFLIFKPWAVAAKVFPER